MKVECQLPIDDLSAIPTAARRAEALGFDGVIVPETSHNPFMALALAAEHSTRLTLGTSVAHAFVRSPTTTAYAAFDVQRLSGGRFSLGLGSQVKGQIERRFGMPWTAPGPRMRDYILAMRAVWACWQERAPLDYRGTHYRLNVMTPNHRPSPLPDVTKGAARVGRSLDAFNISGGGMIATGPTRDAVAKAIEQVRWSVAFYGSTRTSTTVGGEHGWGGAGRQP